MSQADVWGFKWDGVDSASNEGPEIGRYLFQLADARKAFNKKGLPYVNAGCKVMQVISGDEKSLSRMHWEYLSLEEHRKPFTKHFFEHIGAGDCLRPDRGPTDAIGCMFEADVIERDGYKNLRRIIAVDSSGMAGQDQKIEGSKGSKGSKEEDAGEGSQDSQDSEEPELTADDIAAMGAAELKDLAAECEVSLAGLKTLKQKKARLIEELIGDLPAETSPRQAAVGARR